jgi:hypothetical protein
MNVQAVYIFACMLCLVSQAWQGCECGGRMFQSLSTVFHVSGHWLGQTPALSDRWTSLNEWNIADSCLMVVMFGMSAVPHGQCMPWIQALFRHMIATHVLSYYLKMLTDFIL